MHDGQELDESFQERCWALPNSKSLLSSGAEKRAAAGMDAGWFQTSVASGSGELPVLLLARSAARP